LAGESIAGPDAPAVIAVWRQSEGVWVINIAGSVDIASVQAVGRAFDRPLAAGGTELIVELSEAHLVDSTVLGMFVVAAKRWIRLGGLIRFTGVHGHVKKSFDLTGLSRVFVLEERPFASSS
jgi:anti-sigma B factor antagonist